MPNRISRIRDIISNDNNNKIITEIYQDIGGMNYFTSKVKKRGYYFSITPEERSGEFRTYTGFSGAKTCILEVARKSKSAYDKAKAMLDKYENEYLQAFCDKKGYTLVDVNNYVEREMD